MYTCLAVGSITMSAEGELCIRRFTTAVAIFFLVAVGGAYRESGQKLTFEGPVLFFEQLDCR